MMLSLHGIQTRAGGGDLGAAPLKAALVAFDKALSLDPGYASARSAVLIYSHGHAGNARLSTSLKLRNGPFALAPNLAQRVWNCTDARLRAI